MVASLISSLTRLQLRLFCEEDGNPETDEFEF